MPGAMSTNPTGDAGRLSGSSRTLFSVGTLSGLADGQLLERFLRGRGEQDESEAAFAALVERHGAMVLGVCRAVLGDLHDAEDACQAVFLILARRAGTIRKGDSVASWLYGTARRIASRARRDLSRRRAQERRRLERSDPGEPVAPPPTEPCPELYEELDRLPDPFRAAVLLCDLEGHSYEQAAGRLGCPVGTLQSRLARGRQRLRSRLERRGLAPSVIGPGAGASLPTSMINAIVRAASPAAALMAGAEIRRQIMNRLAVMVLLTCGTMATVAVGLSATGQGEAPRVMPVQPTATAKQVAQELVHVRVVDGEGKGVAGITVEVLGADRPASFVADAGGRAAIPREMIGGWGVLAARREKETIAWTDGRPRETSGTADDPIVMRLLPLDHRVEGSVVDPSGRPIAGVKVWTFAVVHPVYGSFASLKGLLDGLIEPAETDPAGRFAMRLPSETDVTLQTLHPRNVGPRINVTTDAHVLAPTTLEPGGSITGRVIDAATGRPIAGATVDASLAELHAGGLMSRGQRISDAQGRFLLARLDPGVYNVTLQKVPGRPNATARAVDPSTSRADRDEVEWTFQPSR